MSTNKDSKRLAPTAQGPEVILLGAGPPHRGSFHPALHEDANHRGVLDWTLDAFESLAARFIFVGGYQMEKVIHRYPKINYLFNPKWETTGPVETLMCAPLEPHLDYYVVYADVVFGRDVVKRMSEVPGDIVVAIDTNWRDRYERRMQDDLADAEKILHQEGRILSASRDLSVLEASAEYAGVSLFRGVAAEFVAGLKQDAAGAVTRMDFPELIQAAIDSKLVVNFVDVRGDWAELNAPQDLARFVLGTKAETLERLAPLVRTCEINDFLTITAAEWVGDRTAILARVEGAFGNRMTAIRSSSRDEDSWATANAGGFLTVVDVPTNDTCAVSDAINRVIASYGAFDPKHQVLVHAMVRDVAVSGVAFTRVLGTGAPYYVINYDETSGRTDQVTSGSGRDLRVLYVHRKADELQNGLNEKFGGLIVALKELEALAGHDSLDVEFATDTSGKIHILQVRPIAVNHGNWNVSAGHLERMLDESIRRYVEKQLPGPFVVGSRTIFGLMPDWNPAEIIGIHPRRLATSLYSWLVTDDVWAQQRAEAGYRDIRPQSLMTIFMGHPYIDVRASLNSFVPATVSDGLAHRLVDYGIETLAREPQLHDKIEFDIAITCITPLIDKQSALLGQSGFSTNEINDLRQALTEITQGILDSVDHHVQSIDLLSARFEKIRNQQVASLDRAFALLDDCRRYGTLPFAHLARAGFVAVSLLRSFVSRGAMSEGELGQFMSSLLTVAGQLRLDTQAVTGGALSWKSFVEKYGHLRQGTYEITSPTYASNSEHFLRPLLEKDSVLVADSPNFKWSSKMKSAISALMAETGLKIDFETLDLFLRVAIEGREFAKFEFTRNLSRALEDIVEFGDQLELSRDILSHLALDDLNATRMGHNAHNASVILSERAEQNRLSHQLNFAVELPPLLVTEMDFRVFELADSQPNFITQKDITGLIADLSDDNILDEFAGRIALIPQADPGYDWLFGQGIVGMITLYGGVNSHMAIRAAEFGLPAAIGVGAAEFEKLRLAKVIQLDCEGKRINVIR